MESNLSHVLQSLRRTAVRLSAGESSLPVVGRFGGLPDAPPDFVWPRFETDTFYDDTVKLRPLSFLAQFDCSALAPFDPEDQLPHTGLLSFFYELESQPWGYDPKDAGGARVFWFPDKNALAPVSFPEDMEEYCRLPSIPFRARASVEYPSYEEFPASLLGSGPETQEGRNLWERFDSVRFALRGYGEEPQPYHRLLGWPDIIQNGMTQQCELVSRGYYLGSSWNNIPAEVRREAEETALDGWRLLFQLDTVTIDSFELMFGDCGCIYFYIRKEDLAARRFDRVWLIQQCC